MATASHRRDIVPLDIEDGCQEAVMVNGQRIVSSYRSTLADTHT